jgi:hypothetical protein
VHCSVSTKYAFSFNTIKHRLMNVFFKFVKTQVYETNSTSSKRIPTHFFDIVHSTKNSGGNLCQDLFARATRRKLHTLLYILWQKKGFFSLWHPILYFWLFLHVIHFSFWTKTTTTLRMHSECHNRLINLVRDFWKP